MSQLIQHFDIADIDGRHVNYASALWQRKLTVLISGAAVPAALRRDAAALNSNDVAVVVTVGALPGLPSAPAAIVDRWGEVAHTWSEPPATVEEIRSWLEHVQMRCPECEGETR